jgi:porphobilinogen synthase
MGINIRSKDLIYPYFVTGGTNKKETIRSFPGVFRFSVDRLLEDIAEIKRLGIDKALIFGVPEGKDAQGSASYDENSIVVSAVRRIKKEFPRLSVMTDVCLCAYTTHGHCGVLAKNKKSLDHKATLEALSKMALTHARAGADYVAPSAMAKGQVGAIRKALDSNGCRKTKIMGYSAKFASNYYGPFRNAAHSAPGFGDRSAYQLDFSDAMDAVRKIKDDAREGADIVMVKPALAYLDIVRQAKASVRVPVAAYNVSGEYVMAKYGAKNGLWDEKKMVAEILTSIKRAGADLIITYHAKDVSKWLGA